MPLARAAEGVVLGRRLPFAANPWPGRLVVLEGASRTGKSTLVARALAKARQDQVVSIEWNSHPLVHPVTTELKHAHALDPLTFSLSHLLDFSLTYQQIAVPALQQGRTVLADRYLYTAWVRDGLRGLDEGLLRSIAPRFVRPDRTFWVSAPLDQIRDRYRGQPEKYGRYGTGADLPGAPDDREESFVDYQRRQQEFYARIAPIEGFVLLTDWRELAACLRGPE